MKVIKEIIFVNLLLIIFAMVIVSNSTVRFSVFLGWLVVLISVTTGIISFKIAKNKENKGFLKVYFGGMIGRLLILLLLIFLILKYISINQISFLFSLFILYLINQIFELRFIIKSSNKK